jgi:hypothetical protein
VSGYKLAAREAGMGEVGLRFHVITRRRVGEHVSRMSPERFPGVAQSGRVAEAHQP